ncbi:MAG TPA: hypothetical protein VJT67_13380, partial [Longimicrobiaceae bacterium]|nr:hypothetical protein [Longimicrobiaceae bacterium]
GRFRFEVTADHPDALPEDTEEAAAVDATPAPSAALASAAPAAPPRSQKKRPKRKPPAQSGPAQQVEACPNAKRLGVQGRVVVGDETGKPIPATIEIRVATADNSSGPFVMIEAGLPNASFHFGESDVLPLAGQTGFAFSVRATGRAADSRCTFDGYLVVKASWDNPVQGGTEPTEQYAVLPLHLVEPPPPGAVYFGEPERVVVMTPRGPRDGKYLWVDVGIDGPPTGTGTVYAARRNFSRNVLAHYRAAFRHDNGLTTSGGSGGRATFGVPVDQTLLLRFTADGPWFERAEYLRLDTAQRQLQVSGKEWSHAAVMHPVPTSTVARKRLALDPGHGVNLEAGEARIYEWLATHQVTDRTAALWTSLGGQVVQTPTARFSEREHPIVVDIAALSGFRQGRTTGARMRLEITPTEYVYEVLRAGITIAEIAASIGYGGREAGFVTDYPLFFRALEARNPAPAGKPPFAVVPGSARWDGTAFTAEYMRTVNGAEERKTAELRAVVGTGLVLDQASVAALARESVRRSFTNEMRAEYRRYLQDPANPKEPSQAVIDYASSVLLRQGEGRSLGPDGRRAFIQQYAPDFAVTVHHNALDGSQAEGVLALVRKGQSSSTKLGLTGRRFLKYVDPLDSGLAGGGFFTATQNVGLVNPPPTDDAYVFLEVDFMDRLEADAAGDPILRYASMLTPKFAETAARQLVAAVAEALATGPQLQDMTPFNELP